MATELSSLSSIFNNSIFRIPDYQRGYAWEERQLQDFWSDLTRITKADNRNHYCGQLTLEKAPNETWATWQDEKSFIDAAGYKPQFVVDGQQRLTTSIILIQVLLDGLADDAPFAGLSVKDQREKYLAKSAGRLRHCLFGYAQDNPSHEFFRTQVLQIPSNDYNGTTTAYTHNIRTALNFFTRKIEKITPEYRESVFRALTQRFKFNLHELGSDLDVFVAFETMNNRGKSLTRLELLKNRLIYLSTLAPGSEAERQKCRSNVNAVWKTIYGELGFHDEEPLDDDEFLRAHWIGYFGHDKSETDPLTNSLLNKEFSVSKVDENKLGLPHIQQYIDSLQACVRVWRKMHDDTGAEFGHQPLDAALSRLRKLGFGVLRPMLLAVLTREGNPEAKTRVMDEAERFLLLVRSLGGARANVGENESYVMARDLFAEKQNLSDAAKMLKDRVRRHFSAAVFQTEVDELFAEDNDKGFYELPGIKFILFEYEESLRKQARDSQAKIAWQKFKGSSTSIEHIYPQSASIVKWPRFQNLTSLQQRYLCHSLGNLLALSISKNSALSNGSFTEKKTGTDKVQGYRMGSFSELAIAQKNDWTPEDIMERGLDMLKFIENRWEVTLGDNATKVKLLKLEFLSPATPITPSVITGNP